MMKTLVYKVILLTVSSAFTLLFCEIALRFVGVSYVSFFTRDDITGSWHNPGAEGIWTAEGYGHVKINSDGLRDREHSRGKPSNTIRIAVLGDSMTDALQVDMNKMYSYLLEQRLNECKAFGNKTVETINFGVSGFGTAQQLQALRYRVWPYTPDIVLLAFITGNDIRNNSKNLSPANAPFFLWDGKELRLDETRLKKRGPVYNLYRKILPHSRVVQLFQRAYVNSRARLEESAAGDGQTGEEVGLDDHVYYEPTQDKWKDGWQVTEQILLKMRDEVQARGAEFVLVTLSSAIQVNPNPDVRRMFMNRHGLDNLFYPDRRIQRIAERERIDHIMLAPKMQQFAQDHNVFLHGFETSNNLGTGHWNEQGHSLAARLMAGKWCGSRLNNEVRGLDVSGLKESSQRHQ